MQAINDGSCIIFCPRQVPNPRRPNGVETLESTLAILSYRGNSEMSTVISETVGRE
jgi:hypothetical protein